MQRLTATFLLLFALAGSLLPPALVAAAAPAHACCLRMAHRCHSSTTSESEPDRLAFRNPGCCNHDCCRALTTPQWAHPRLPATSAFAHPIEAGVVESRPNPAAAAHFASPSTRAPPYFNIV
jgi:hypothetical protein